MPGLEKGMREEWNMKKGILLVSFGSGNKEAVEETLGKLKKEAEERFPTYAIYQAFTSGQIREKWREIYQISVDSPEQAFRNMQQEGIEQVVVQPVYVAVSYTHLARPTGLWILLGVFGAAILLPGRSFWKRFGKMKRRKYQEEKLTR